MNLPIHAVDRIDAQARGRRRLYKQKLAADYAAFDATFRSIDRSQVEDFMLKSGKGRRRIFDRINAAMIRHGGRLEALRLDGKWPLALWAILKPRGAVTVDPDHPRDDQDCVAVNYFEIGWQPDRSDGCVDESLWSLEITDHALGRCLQRTPDIDLTSIFELHLAILNVDARDLPRSSEQNIPFRLRVGPATWMCEICVGYDVSFNGYGAHIVVRHYLEFDQLNSRQEAELIEPKPRATGFRLGDGWLMPALFRRLEPAGPAVSIHTLKEPPPLIALAAASPTASNLKGLP